MNIIAWFLWCLVALWSSVFVKAGGGGGGKDHVKFIIHYPVKTIKHTHTIYKHVHHKHGGGGGGKPHSHGGTPKGWEWD